MNPTPTLQQSDSLRLAERFAAIVGAQHVLADVAAREEFSQDLIEWEGAALAALVIRPADSRQLAAVVAHAGALGLALAPRGGGLSYTQGYAPQLENTIALDLTRLNRIHELNADDRYLTAGAGATWQQVYDAAKAVGLRPVLRGPISGSHSTIGGAASQGLLGPTDGFLGFEVVLADGRVVRTGAGCSLRTPAFYRHFGPDLTGLFTGDTGALGVKSAVTLKLEKPPRGLRMASFSFPRLPLLVEAIVAVTRENVVPRLFGMDPLKTRVASKVGLLEGAQTVGSIVAGRSSIKDGLADAVAVLRSGRGALDEVDWALHVHAEGIDDEAAEAVLSRVRDICLRSGREVNANIAIALNAKPYSVRGFVGLEGERFVPIHAIVPLSRAVAVAEHIERLFAEHEKVFAEHQITTCCLAGMENGVFVIEPMFYWPDKLGPLHRRYLPPQKFARLDRSPANLKTRTIVIEMREKLRRMFFDLGAIHGQIGKYYDFKGAVDPGVYELLTTIKQTLDPACRLNPGNFGWSPRAGGK